MNKDRVILIASLCFFSVVSALVYFYAPDVTAHFEGDSVRYDMIARNITFLPEMPLEVLGYPFFLGVFYKLFNNSIGIIVFLQFLLSIICLFLFRRISFRLGGNAARNWITILWALNSGFLIYTQLLLLEIFLAFWLLLFIERVVTYYFERRMIFLVQAAFVLGISILFRPAALFYALFFAVFLLFIKDQSFSRRIGSFILFIVAFYCPIIFYMFFNFIIFGRFVVCPVMNVNLFLIYYPKIELAFGQMGIVSNSLMASIKQDITSESITFKTQLNLLKLMFSYPFITIKIWIINMIKSFIGLYLAQWKLYFELGDQATSFFTFPGSFLEKMHGYIITGTNLKWLHIFGWLEVIYLIIEYIAAFVGLAYFVLKRYAWLSFFAFSFIFYFAFITGPDGSGRFRMMFEPWLLIIAALGLAFIFSKNKKKVFG